MPRVVLLLVLWLIGCTLPACTRGHPGLYGTVIPVTTIIDNSASDGSGVLIGTRSDQFCHLLITQHQNFEKNHRLQLPDGEMNVAARHEHAKLILLKLDRPHTPHNRVLPLFWKYSEARGDRFYLEGYPAPMGDPNASRQRTILVAIPATVEGEEHLQNQPFDFVIEPEPPSPPFGISGGAYIVARESGSSEIIGIIQGQRALGHTTDGQFRSLSYAERIGPWVYEAVVQDSRSAPFPRNDPLPQCPGIKGKIEHDQAR